MSHWAQVLPYMLTFTVVLFVPGYLIGRLLHLKTLVGWAAAPALSCAFVGLSSWGLHLLGIYWRPLSVFGALTVVILVGVSVRRAAARFHAPQVASSADPPVSSVRRDRGRFGTVVSYLVSHVWLIGALVVGSLVVALPAVRGMTDPSLPLQSWDSVYHLNVVASMLESGNAAQPLGMYGSHVETPYYPTVWHAMATLSHQMIGVRTGTSVLLAANASSLVLMTVGWLVPLAGFAQACFPRRRLVVAIAVIVAGSWSMFPNLFLSIFGVWPNALEIAVLPGAAATAIVAIRAWGNSVRGSSPGLAGGGGVAAAHERGSLRGGSMPVRMPFVAAAAATLGAVMAHPSAIFATLVIVGPTAVAEVLRVSRSVWVRRRRLVLMLTWAGGTVAVAGVAVVLSRTSILRSVTEFGRPSGESFLPLVRQTLLDTHINGRPGNLVLTMAVVLAAVMAVRRRHGRGLVVSAFLVVCLAASAQSSIAWVQALSGPWYRSGPRIEAMFPMLAAVLAAFAIAGLATGVVRALHGWATRSGLARLSERAILVAVVVGVLAVSAGTSSLFQSGALSSRFAQAYVPKQINLGAMLSRGEIALLDRLPDLVPVTARVIGQPADGASFAWSIGQRQVVFPQLSPNGIDAERVYLGDHLRELRSDPRVCEILDDLDVRYLVIDDKARPGRSGVPRWPGLENVDTSRGFVKVASGGGMYLYRIEACDVD